MRKKSFILLLTALVSLLLLFPLPSSGQLILGQYEDEASLGSWNQYGLINGFSAGMGGVLFAASTDCSSSLSNPALLSFLPKFTFSLNSSYSSYALFKYAIINTGVLTTDKNAFINVYAIDFGGVSLRWKGWTISFSRALSELYDRPSTEQTYYYKGKLYYRLNFDQEGHLMTTHISAARAFGRRLSIGIGLNLISGRLTKNTKEEWVSSNITITDDKSFAFKGQYINGGLWLRISEKWAAAVIFRMPFKKRAEAESSYRFLSPAGNTDISIDASAENSYSQPLVLGVGLSFQPSPKFRLFSDVSFFNWSEYEITYFEERIKRNFRDTFKWGAGVEYLSAVAVFGEEFTVPLRGGFSYDPQPMKEPRSSYYYFSMGTGLRWRNASLDAGASFGSESGSGASLSAKRICISLSFWL